jgi:butyrate kinase
MANNAAVNENIHDFNAEMAKNRAADPTRGVVERVEAGTHYVAEKIKEGGSEMSYQHHKKEQAKHA